METSVRSDREGTIGEVVTKPGETVDAKDLLFVFA
jgi:biotin carboxyl carrier protein